MSHHSCFYVTLKVVTFCHTLVDYLSFIGPPCIRNDRLCWKRHARGGDSLILSFLFSLEINLWSLNISTTFMQMHFYSAEFERVSIIVLFNASSNLWLSDLCINISLRWRHNGCDGVSNHQPLFTQPFIRTQIKENIKVPRHWPLCGEFIGDRWIPRTNGQ